MSDHHELLQAFVEFADTLVADYDVVEFLQRLSERCVALLDVSHAGVMLAGRGGDLRYVASSSEQMRLIELLELQHLEGPCLDAFRFDGPQSSASADESDARWPTFGPLARNAGFGAMAAVPLRLRAVVIGALNLFSTESGGLSSDDALVAQALADVATIGILHERALTDAQVLSNQLELALESRVAIEQAKGMLAERLGVSTDNAFEALRNHARSHNVKLTDTANAVITGALPSVQLAQPGRRDSTAK